MLARWLVGWLLCWLAGWLVGWLVCHLDNNKSTEQISTKFSVLDKGTDPGSLSVSLQDRVFFDISISMDQAYLGGCITCVDLVT